MVTALLPVLASNLALLSPAARHQPLRPLRASRQTPQFRAASADELFEEAVRLCESYAAGEASAAKFETVPPLLDLVFARDYADLHASHYEPNDNPHRIVANVSCAQPAAGEWQPGQQLYDDDLLVLPTRAGRACVGGNCGCACSRVQLRQLASDAECDAMVSQAEALQPASSDAADAAYAADAGTHNLYLKLTAAAGALRATLLFVRLLERLRRAVAREYGLPLSSVAPMQAFVSRKTRSSDAARELVHVDECSTAAFHYSAVLYLSSSEEAIAANAMPGGADGGRGGGEGGADFAGGELRWFAPQQPEQRSPDVPVLLPRRGMAALFSSGWENPHQVAPVTSGVRRSLPAFFTTCAPASRPPWGADGSAGGGCECGGSAGAAASSRAAVLWRHALMPRSEEDFIAYLRHWALVWDPEQW